MTPGTIATPPKESPLLFEGLNWREFKAVEQILDRPGYRFSFLNGVLEIRRRSGEAQEIVSTNTTKIGTLLRFSAKA